MQKTHLLAAASLLSLLISGCELLGPEMPKKLPLQPAAPTAPESERQRSAELATPKDTEPRKPPEIYLGTGKTVGTVPGRGVRPSKDRQGKFTLNFDDADLGEVAKVILGDTLKANYVISPKVAGRVSLQTTRALTSDELLPTLEIILRMNGAALLREGSLFRIEPDAAALQEARSVSLGTPGQQIPAGYQIRIVPLRYVGVAEMQKVVEPLMPPKSIIRADETRNLLVLAGPSGELESVIDTIGVFDVDFMRGMSVGLFPLKNVDPVTLQEELEKVLGDTEKGPLAGVFRLLPIERMNSILAITQQPRYLDDVAMWIERLDRATTAAGDVHVYRVQNVDAVELAETLTNIFSKEKPAQTPKPSVAPGQKPAEIGGTRPEGEERTAGARTGAAGGLGKKPAAGKKSTATDIGGIRIIADAPNNALIIVATAQEYTKIDNAIRQLDILPLQVLVDATIVEVTLTDQLEYGLQWFFQNFRSGRDENGNFANLREGSFLGNAAANALSAASRGGFSYSMVNNSGDVRVVLNALAVENKANVISSPSLMVLNNQEARINVGDKVPTPSSTSVPITSGVSGGTGGTTISPFATSTLQFTETGVTLKIKPRVNAGGLVIMEVSQEVSEPISVRVANTDAFQIHQRTIESSVAVQSGDTLVLGGLIRDIGSRVNTGIPILSRIPLIGPLFGTNTRRRDKTELVVLITPRALESRVNAQSITNEFKRKLTGIYEEVPASGDAKGRPTLKR
jgi:general secretion pathway protein D